MTGFTRILGCDYGERRTGLAVSDAGRSIAFPAGVVEARTVAEAARRVAAAAAEHEAAEIVVGLPLTLRGEHGPQAEATLAFVALLQAGFEGPIHSWDERLTTTASLRALEEMGGSKRHRGRVDELAATLMLQSYLDSKCTPGSAGE